MFKSLTFVLAVFAIAEPAEARSNLSGLTRRAAHRIKTSSQLIKRVVVLGATNGIRRFRIKHNVDPAAASKSIARSLGIGAVVVPTVFAVAGELNGTPLDIQTLANVSAVFGGALGSIDALASAIVQTPAAIRGMIEEFRLVRQEKRAGTLKLKGTLVPYDAELLSSAFN
ncbi:MAG: hypothetical protein H6707_14870 [Deltaproteobacteria bacterium]|nr:hypothetical protein [Deltaproteobacteria bacterium]